jgi:hypothetical protein
MLWLESKLAQLCLIIDSALYSAVAWLYELFLKIAQTEIFTDSIYESLAQRIYIVLGIFMLFVLAYSLLTAIVNPDNLTKGDKSMSKVATKLVTSLIIIGLLPTIFSYGRKLQNFILENNVIGTILFGNSETDITVREYDEDGQNYTEKIVTLSGKEMAQAQISSYGRIMSFTALNAFLNPTNTKFQFDAGEFTVNNGYVNTGSIMGCIAGVAAGTGISIFTLGTGVGAGLAVGAVSCGAAGATVNWVGNQIDYTHYTWDQMKWAIINDGDFTQIISLANVIHEGAKSMDGSETIHVQYTPFVSTICAGFLLYLLASFCIDLGIRSVRLAFLQLIAPIPIFMRALPGKGQPFDKWLKKTIATFLEVFIRVLLMYLVVFFMSNVNFNTSTWQGLWVKVIVFMGCIAFVKVAPKEISEMIGVDSGNIKLGIMPKLAAGGALTGAALVGSGITAGVRNAYHGIQNVRSANGVRGKVGAAIRGVGSMGAGTLSGAVRGGYAGRGAKNLADLRNASVAGAKGAVDARDRREAYRIAHQNDPLGVAGAQVMDFGKNVRDWVVGGFEAEEAKLKFYNDMIGIQDKANKAAEKIMNKYSTNINLKATNVDYKGVSATNKAEFDALFQSSNLATIQNTLESMSKQKIERTTRMTDEQYAEAVRDYNQKMSDYNSMYKQLEKASIKKIQSFAYDESAMLAAGLAEKDVTAIRMEMDQAKNLLSSHGGGYDMVLDGSHFADRTVDALGNEISAASGAGFSFDSALSAIEQDRNKLAASVEQKKQERAARQSNSSGGKK